MHAAATCTRGSVQRYHNYWILLTVEYNPLSRTATLYYMMETTYLRSKDDAEEESRWNHMPSKPSRTFVATTGCLLVITITVVFGLTQVQDRLTEHELRHMTETLSQVQEETKQVKEEIIKVTNEMKEVKDELSTVQADLQTVKEELKQCKHQPTEATYSSKNDTKGENKTPGQRGTHVPGKEGEMSEAEGDVKQTRNNNSADPKALKKRTRRDVGSDGEGGLQEHHRKGRAGRHVQKAAAPVFVTDAVHLYPVHLSNETQQEVNETGEAREDGNVRTVKGLRIIRENMNFWTLDHHSQGKDWVTYVNGFLQVSKSGTYFVYAQVSHHDVLGSWSYGVYRRVEGGEEHIISQCPGMEPHVPISQGKAYPVLFQCHTSRVLHLRAGEQIFLKNNYYHYENRVVKMDRHLTFWGLIRLAD